MDHFKVLKSKTCKYFLNIELCEAYSTVKISNKHLPEYPKDTGHYDFLQSHRAFLQLFEQNAANNDDDGKTSSALKHLE